MNYYLGQIMPHGLKLAYDCNSFVDENLNNIFVLIFYSPKKKGSSQVQCQKHNNARSRKFLVL